MLMSILRVQSIPVAPEPLGTGARAPPLWDMAIGTEGHRRASFDWNTSRIKARCWFLSSTQSWILPERAKIQAVWSCCIYTAAAKLHNIINCWFNGKMASEQPMLKTTLQIVRINGKPGCRWQTVRRVCANAMTMACIGDLHTLPMCYMPNFVVLR